MAKAISDARGGDKDKIAYNALLERIKPELESGKLAYSLDLTDEEKEMLRDLHLITQKPMMFIVNVSEKDVAIINEDNLKKELGLKETDKVIPISARVEAELIAFNEEEAKAYLQELGLKETGLHCVIREAYDILGLENYFTAGEKEVRAWTIRRGAKAPEAAGAIHTDFEKGFIRAEVISYQDYITCGGELKAREKGLMRLEGKEYIVKDGDVMHFRFSE
jgi:hypothetical protein